MASEKRQCSVLHVAGGARLVATTLVLTGLLAAAVGGEQVPASTSRVSPTHAPVAVPALPAGADAVPALRFTRTSVVRVKGAEVRRSVHRVTRARDRVHIAVDDEAVEWLFVRNPVHPTRVEAFQVRHAAREILTLADSDLRTSYGVRGWADVLLLQVDAAAIQATRPTGDTTTHGGWRFERRVAPASSTAGLREIWWADDLLLPLRTRSESAGRTVTTAVSGLHRAPDATVLVDPPQRYPDYHVLGVADSRDHRLHGH